MGPNQTRKFCIAKETEWRCLKKLKTIVVAKGKREGVGWIGSLGLVDTDYCLWN